MGGRRKAKRMKKGGGDKGGELEVGADVEAGIELGRELGRDSIERQIVEKTHGEKE